MYDFDRFADRSGTVQWFPLERAGDVGFAVPHVFADTLGAKVPLRRNPEIMVTRLEDEVVLLDPSTREIFTLNTTGAIVWDEIERGTDAIVTRVCEAFNIDPATARRDVEELIEKLQSRGLAAEA